MADNILVTPGIGATVSADEIAGALHQRVKITVGADGVNDGDVSSSNPMPINDAGGSITVDGTVAVSGSVSVTGGLTDAELRASAVPVSAASLPLPTGAATAALQTQPGVDIGDVTVNNAAGASAVNIQDGGNSITVDGTFWQATQPVSAASLPLPTGASTSANQSTIIGHVDGIETLLGTIDTDTGNIASSVASIAAEDFATETTLAAASAKLTDASQKTQIVDGSGNVIGSTSNALDVNIKSGITLEVNLDNAADDVLVYGFDGSANQKIKTDANGELQIDVLSSALPTGAATEATLSSIDADTGNIATSVAGLLTDTQLRATPVPISGTVTANLGTIAGVATESTLSALNTKIPSSLTVTSTRLLVDGSGVTQPISGTITVNDNGYSSVAFVRNDYTSVNVTTSAYVELVASTASAYKEIEIFDSSGQTLKIAFGAAASEVDKQLLFPGGNGTIKLAVPSGTRISIKAVSGTASTGEIGINFRG